MLFYNFWNVQVNLRGMAVALFYWRLPVMQKHLYNRLAEARRVAHRQSGVEMLHGHLFLALDEARNSRNITF